TTTRPGWATRFPSTGISTSTSRRAHWRTSKRISKSSKGRSPDCSRGWCMSDKRAQAGEGEILIYPVDDRGAIRVLLEGETVWLTQAQIAELFQTTPQNVTQHLKAI